MTWQEKMNVVIGEVLGEGYHIEVIDDSHFKTYHADFLINETETLLSVSAHWRKHVKDTIGIVISQRVEHAFSKI